MTLVCLCDAAGDGPCPAHERENRLQNELITLKNDMILDDAEIRDLTVWETDEEIPAFRLGWRYRREHGPAKERPEARALLASGEIQIEDSQNSRVGWERGWWAADLVHSALVASLTVEEATAEIRAECDVCHEKGARKSGDLLLCGTCHAVESNLVRYLSVGGPARAFVERALETSYGAEVPDRIAKECAGLRDLLLSKNAAYGNSALDPLRIMSKASPVEQILVRIDDKLSRLARGSAAGEDVELDLLGYLILLRVARQDKTEK